MKVTYLNHSGFLLEWDTCYWIFDYYKGEMPKLDPAKEIFVFVSHSHGDHFNPMVLALTTAYPKVTYVFSNEVKQACRKFAKTSGGIRLSQKQIRKVCGGMEREGKLPENNLAENNLLESDLLENNLLENNLAENDLPKNNLLENDLLENNLPKNNLLENDLPENNLPKNSMPKNISESRQVQQDSKATYLIPIPEIQFLRSRNHMELHDQQGNPLNIYGLQSTDCGCAFLIEYQGKTVYHAGDLHWWYWSGEAESFNKKMTADFKKEMEYLAGRQIDLAFNPLDPRQGSDYALGMNYFLKQAKVKNVFPMHCWNDYSVCGKYQREYQLPRHTMFYPVEWDGQSWELDF